MIIHKKQINKSKHISFDQIKNRIAIEIKDALQNSNFSVEVVKVSFESSLESAKVSNF